MTLAHFLDGLRCSVCGTLNMLWLDPVRGMVECRECGHSALCLLDSGEAA
ncbi:hypothetical protein ABZU32_34135 [Sphaerisporangium sp. NPDC005288]